MLPSLVVNEVRNGVAEILRDQFEPSQRHFKDAFRRLIDEPTWVKGPYVQLEMPFVSGASGKTFFTGYSTQYPAYEHQEVAWKRCGTEKKSTLIATGTDSGKTECFLYPVLDYVAKVRQEGIQGIKAIIVYPMNALADDQAGRLAELVYQTPAFNGIRAGLFVGTGRTKFNPAKSGKNPVQEKILMEPDHVITDKNVMRQNPPDILLTNYKMLDFLMIRPEDQDLWRYNESDTLRYLVVDEMHTFDGAQGTDLAMLIRRLRHRLECSEDKLVCVGTSATLGNSENTESLREFASQVFAAKFDEHSVIFESRLRFDEFIGNCVIEHLIADDNTVFEAIRQEKFSDELETVKTFLPAFIANPEVLKNLQTSIDSAKGRIQLGEELKKHILFQNLLKLAMNGPISVDDVAEKMSRTLSIRLNPYASDIVMALLTLVAWARAPHTGQEVSAITAPEQLNRFVSLRVQVWFQELGRVLSTVSADAKNIDMRTEASVLANVQQIRLPVVQCNNCRATGWLTIKEIQNRKIETNPDRIYQSFFSRHRDSSLARIYPAVDLEIGVDRGLNPVLARIPKQDFCGHCGAFNNAGKKENEEEKCSSCQRSDLLTVYVVSKTKVDTWTRKRNGKSEEHRATVHDDICPSCEETGHLMIVGARTTTIAAHTVERLWASPLNNHKKLILFSDSVQDAAHRAGYIESKSENHLMRAGLVKAMAALSENCAWSEALEFLGNIHKSESSPFAMSPRDFVAQFIPPQMEWLNDWRTLQLQGNLPKDSDLPRMLAKRLRWKAIEDLTHLANRGPTLSKTGLAVLFPNLSELRRISGPLTQKLKDIGDGLENLTEEKVFHWVVGFVLMMVRSGGIYHVNLEHVARTGTFYTFRYQRRFWLPNRGKAPTPQFLTAESGKHHFLNLNLKPSNPLNKWATLALTPGMHSRDIIKLAYEKLLQVLEQSGIGRYVPLEMKGDGKTFGLNPDHLFLCQNLKRLSTPSGVDTRWVPHESAVQLDGMPSLKSPAEVFRPDTAASSSWWQSRMKGVDFTRVIAKEHTGLLERDERVELQNRFMAESDQAEPWYENLLSATPTLELGIDIGSLSTVMLGGVPPGRANFIQRTGRAGRRDGNAVVFLIANASADGYDQHYFSDPLEMLHGAVDVPAIYLGAAEVLQRQIYAFFFDRWVTEDKPSLPRNLGEVLDQVEAGRANPTAFPYNYLEFINRHRSKLFNVFCRLLGDHLTESTREKLEAIISGSEQSKNLQNRFLAFFEDANSERESWRKHRKRINSELHKQKQRVQDEQTESDIKDLEKERDSLSTRITRLNSEYLLEAMTNAGLLPNYAFPEEGISMTHIVHGTSMQGKKYSISVYRYNRPAAAALHEFAPRNTFFAHKNKLQIDQIDIGAESPNDYRFCAKCHNLTLTSDPDARLDACPRCGDSHWSDTSQVRPLFRLKRVVANVTHSGKTQITESDENRRQRIYRRKLLMNFKVNEVRDAWKFASSKAIYGFEFVARAAFHDINTGEYISTSSPNLQTTIADDDSYKVGFSLCSECGKVQPHFSNDNSADENQEHMPSCRLRHLAGRKHLHNNVFLFREFESECLRIMVPRGFDSGDRTTYSFMSALQLGIRERFGGKVDHLRFDTTEEPDSEGNNRKYILIYDSVPGGTGYLQQLLSGEATTLEEVLSLARDVIQNCSCKDTPDTDGCYQCVFYFQHRRNRLSISRTTALEILNVLIDDDFKRSRVNCLFEIYVRQSFGSELERRFLPSLRALGGQVVAGNSKLPSVNITQEIVEGKTAYLLVVGENKYWVKQQVEIESPSTGQTLCQPDFVIHPTKLNSLMVPIAIFVDGWQYHQDNLPDDARKRSTLMLSDDYRVWSVTYEDIKSAEESNPGTDLNDPLEFLSSESGKKIPNDRVPTLHTNFVRFNAVAQLIELLNHSDSDPLTSLKESGQHLLIRTVLKNSEVTDQIKKDSSAVCSLIPDWLIDSDQTVYLHSSNSGGVQWTGRAVREFFILGNISSKKYPVAGALVLDDSDCERKSDHARVRWRRWLRLANLLQALSGIVLLTGSMVRSNKGLSVIQPKSEIPQTVSEKWNKILDDDLFLNRLKSGFLELANTDVPAPDKVGFEFESGDEYRAGEAVWNKERVVFLSQGQTEFASSWKENGYMTVEEIGNWWDEVKIVIEERKHEAT